VKVFISWSGEPSRSIARALDGWLQSVVQRVEPWMSDEQIKSGTRWREVIGTALDKTDFGIICLTRANQHEPWLVFEAGALAKRLEVARLVPLFIEMGPSDVTGPLEGWQGQPLTRDGMKRLVYDLNEAAGEEKGGKSVPIDRLGGLFDAMWPDLESAVSRAMEVSPKADESARDTTDMLAELVERTRRIEDRLPATGTVTFTGFVGDSPLSYDVMAPIELKTTGYAISSGQERRKIIRIAGKDYSYSAAPDDPGSDESS
jgi:TIR domain